MSGNLSLITFLSFLQSISLRNYETILRCVCDNTSCKIISLCIEAYRTKVCLGSSRSCRGRGCRHAAFATPVPRPIQALREGFMQQADALVGGHRPQHLRRPLGALRGIGYTKLDSFVRAGRVGRSPWRTRSTPRHFTDELKRQIVELVNARKSKADAMRKCDLSKSTVGRWVKSIQRCGIAACRRQPYARAEPGDRAGARESQAAHGGRSFKTSGADIRTKVTVIAANADRYPVSAQCEIIGVARLIHCSMRPRGRPTPLSPPCWRRTRPAAGATGPARSRRRSPGTA